MKISIVIPSFNEEKNIQHLIYYLKNNSSADIIKEIIVSDGGSKDNTIQLAELAGATIVTGKKGRAQQLNRGARHASGEILYFLHADSYPPKYFDKEIIQHVMNNSEAGCFIMKFDNKHPFMKFWSWMTQFTGSYFRGGDQSLFVTRNLFETVSGYNEKMRIMEDYDIVFKLRSKTRFAVIKKWITTSARKYEKVGMYRLQLKFAMIYFMYGLGFSQDTLVNYYINQIEKTG